VNATAFVPPCPRASVVATAAARAFGAEGWNQFRSPAAGVAKDKDLADTWSSAQNVVCKVDLPGRG
jgi:hypothetical protein